MRTRPSPRSDLSKFIEIVCLPAAARPNMSLKGRGGGGDGGPTALPLSASAADDDDVIH